MRSRLVWSTGVLVGVWILVAVVRGVRASASLAAIAPYVYAPLLIVGGGLLGVVAVRRLGLRSLARVVLVVGVFVALSALLSDHPGRGAIGYANANAALAVQLIALAGLLTLVPSVRRLAWGGVVAGVVAVAANSSAGATAAAVVVLVALVLALVLRGGRRRWPAVLVSLLICGAAVGTLMQLARRVAWPDWALVALDPVRRALWNTAWSAFRRAETFGFGPGGFAQFAPLARDEDTMSAHSLPLQVAAELGSVGLVLLTLLFLCGLWWAASVALVRASWIAVAAWTALAAHAFMDHLVEFWPVPLAAGLVLGVAYALDPADPATSSKYQPNGDATSSKLQPNGDPTTSSKWQPIRDPATRQRRHFFQIAARRRAAHAGPSHPRTIVFL